LFEFAALDAILPRTPLSAAAGRGSAAQPDIESEIREPFGYAIVSGLALSQFLTASKRRRTGAASGNSGD
jgi:hypothetical protein